MSDTRRTSGNQRRCEETQEVPGLGFLQCQLPEWHEGEHKVTVDDPSLDPNYTYVVSWSPR